MRADVFILPTPVADDHSCFGQGPWLFAIQTLFPEAGIEALHVSIITWASRFDIDCLDSLFGKPASKPVFDQLRAVVAAEAIGNSAAIDQRGRNLPDLSGLFGGPRGCIGTRACARRSRRARKGCLRAWCCREQSPRSRCDCDASPRSEGP